MTRKLLAILFAAFVAGVLPAAADDTFFAEQKLTEYLAKDRLIGANVHDNGGKIVGDIEDLIVDNDNRIVGVIIGVGGLLGLGEKKVGVSISALSIEATDGKMNVVMPAATKEALTAAPAYKRVNPPKGWLQRAVEKGEELRDKSKDALDAEKEQAGPALEKAKSAAQPAESPKN
jgi:sporulation protein YlmC with PRC-barrel domain